jgi:hypothetical protein
MSKGDAKVGRSAGKNIVPIFKELDRPGRNRNG